jgi:hypothetical protein
LLDTYEAERRPVFASLARDFIGNFIEEDRDFLRSYSPEKDAEEFAAKWAARSEDKSEVFAYEPNYEGSPIVGGPGSPSARGDHRFEARAGHHLSPRALSDGRTTYHALSADFTLFDFASDGAGAEFLDAAADAGVPLGVVTDTYEGERADYGAPLILVRPDGFVAWCGSTGDPTAILALATGRLA